MTGPGSPAARLSFERAAILRGELWRVLTGQWLHGSAGHLSWNALALALGALSLWRLRGGRRTLAVFALGHLVTALTVLFLIPRWASYQGASGVAAAMVGGALAAGLCEEAKELRRASLAGVLLLLLKLYLEARDGVPVLVSAPGMVTDWKVHALPALAGALLGGRRAGSLWPRKTADPAPGRSKGPRLPPCRDAWGGN